MAAVELRTWKVSNAWPAVMKNKASSVDHEMFIQPKLASKTKCDNRTFTIHGKIVGLAFVGASGVAVPEHSCARASQVLSYPLLVVFVQVVYAKWFWKNLYRGDLGIHYGFTASHLQKCNFVTPARIYFASIQL